MRLMIINCYLISEFWGNERSTEFWWLNLTPELVSLLILCCFEAKFIFQILNQFAAETFSLAFYSLKETQSLTSWKILNFLPGFLENPGVPGRNPAFLSFLVGSSFKIWRYQIRKTHLKTYWLSVGHFLTLENIINVSMNSEKKSML